MAKFLNEEDARRELATQDVFLLQQHWDGGGRLGGTDIVPVDGFGTQPIVAANMNAVSGSRMAETLGRLGGFAVLPQDIAPQDLSMVVGKVKGANPLYATALTLDPDDKIRDAASIIWKRSSRIVVVVDQNLSPIGVLTPRDIRDKDMYAPIRRFMSTSVVTVPYDAPTDTAFRILDAAHVDAAPVVGTGGILAGVVSKQELIARAFVRPALGRDRKLMVGVAININGDVAGKVQRALDVGVDLIVLDTAHGFQRKMLEAIAVARGVIGDCVPIVAGNVCSRKGADALFDAGADTVKVGVGPGGACTTRIQTGVGRPQLSAVLDCVQSARERGKHIWADGGVRDPRDLVYYLAAGASHVMIGTLFAGTYESPGDLQFDRDGQGFKRHWGMASVRAVGERNGDRSAYDGAVRAAFKEGVSDSVVYLKPGLESVCGIVLEFLAGLKSAMTYTGAHDLGQFAERAVFGVQTQSGYIEGTPHGRISK